MSIVRTILILICVVAVLFGPDEANAVPWLVVGGLGALFIIIDLIEVAS